ncbi:MAG: aminotransferase class V-fold PLP-dependent enzyme, partial [SAR324 cluster bacterium]|nr:aminotransferase class V-fold PLP-dependent enzyme [SAR324 cluster bacterium]
MPGAARPSAHRTWRQAAPAPFTLTPIYLDYNATAPLHPVAREAMLSAMEAWPGNPSSPHAHGQAARNALEEARAGLAGLLGFARREVIFTSGGTESDNLAIAGTARALKAK